MANFNKIDSNLSAVPEPEVNQCSQEDTKPSSPSEPECPPPLSSSFEEGVAEKLISYSPRFPSGAAKLFSPIEPDPLFVSVMGAPIYFGNVNVYASRSKSFSITNNSDKDVRVSLSTSFPFRVDSGGLIRAHQTGYFTVTFNPNRAGHFNGFISGSHGVNIGLDGSGVDPYKK